MKGWPANAMFMSFGVVLIMGVSGVDAMSCSDAIEALIPCTPFLVGSGGAAKPSGECCENAQKLNNMSNTTEARRAICKCFVDSAPSFGVNPERVKLLPKLCHLNLAIPGTKVNCSQIPTTYV